MPSPKVDGASARAVVSPKKAATKINAITTQSFIIYAVRLSSITVRAANENSLANAEWRAATRRNSTAARTPDVTAPQ
jgi:hypothetical protein